MSSVLAVQADDGLVPDLPLHLAAYARAAVRPRVPPLEGSTLHLRVMPWDLHVTRMQHVRFHAMMDVGRMDLVARTGIMRRVMRDKWVPITAAIHFEAYRALKLWDGYALTTRVAFWDDKWVWLEHRFEKDGDLVALGYARTLMRGPAGNVPTRDVVAATGEDPGMPSPPVPDALARMVRAVGESA